jgi:hypothetical protein
MSGACDPRTGFRYHGTRELGYSIATGVRVVNFTLAGGLIRAVPSVLHPPDHTARSEAGLQLESVATPVRTTISMAKPIIPLIL